MSSVRDLLEDEGIDIVLNARVKQVSGKSGESVSLVVEQNGAEKTLTGSDILVAAGRTPNTEGLGLELAGVERLLDVLAQASFRRELDALCGYDTRQTGRRITQNDTIK